ncbi:MAG: hypothetical protein LKG11_04870 [Bacilli bacterium]|jgi:maltodextrin utilization protein YvdJ|nr:hypothetical protein [Bacilli bacterium]
MSKNKKNKNSAKKIWTATKSFLRTLISNDACVDKRESHWWSAIIVFLISIMIAVSPYSYYNWKTKGGDILNEPTYGINEGLIAFAEDAAKQTALTDIHIDADTDTLSVNGWNDAYKNLSNTFNYIATYEKETVTTSENSDGTTATTYGKETVTEVRFSVYYIPSLNETFQSTFKTILGGSDANGNETYSVSTLFLGINEFYLVEKPSGSSSAKAALIGKYDGFGESFSLKDMTKQDPDGKAFTVTADDFTESTYGSYYSQAKAAWVKFMTYSYNSTIYMNGWVGTGIAWAIDVALVFLMGLMLFLMTRGKSNPYRIYTFWQTQKIAYWAALAPALLALIIGFALNNSYSLFFFLFLYGMRTMWMSMHSLSPNYQSGN